MHKRAAYVAPKGTTPQPLRPAVAADLPAAALRTPFFAASDVLRGAPPPLLRAAQLCVRPRHTVINKQRCPINCVTWMPGGGQLLTGGSSGEFALWSGTELGKFETIIQAHDGAAVRAMAWSPNDSWLLSGDDTGALKYWQDTLNNVKRLPAAHALSVRAVAFAPTGLKFVSGGDDNAVRIWDFDTARVEHECSGHGQEVRGAAWSARSLVATCSKDAAIKLFDPRAGGRALRTLHAHNLGVNVVAWVGGGGDQLLSGARDGLLKAHDVRCLGAGPVCTYRGGHADTEVTCAALAPADATFASGGLDGSLAHWLLGDPEPAHTQPKAHDKEVWALAYHPAGVALASASNDCATKVWARAKHDLDCLL